MSDDRQDLPSPRPAGPVIEPPANGGPVPSPGVPHNGRTPQTSPYQTEAEGRHGAQRGYTPPVGQGPAPSPRRQRTPLDQQTEIIPATVDGAPTVSPEQHREFADYVNATIDAQPVESAQPSIQPTPAPAFPMQSAPTIPPNFAGQQQPVPVPPPFVAQQHPGAALHQGGQHEPQPVRPMSRAMDDVSEDLLRYQQGPRAELTAWRAFLNSIPGLTVGPGKAALEYADLRAEIRTPKTVYQTMAVLAPTGHAGASIVTGVLGQVFSSHRGDAVMGVDADPDGGDLDILTARHNKGHTARDLLNQETGTNDVNFVKSFFSLTPTNFYVLANVWNPGSSDQLSHDDVLDLNSIMRFHYDFALIDGGHGLQTDTANGILQTANSMVLVARASSAGVRNVARSIDWLRAHGYSALLANTVIVLNNNREKPTISSEAFFELFEAKQQMTVHEIPYDPHLDADGPIDLKSLKPKTLRAFEELAALLATNTFNSPYVPPGVQEILDANGGAR